MEDVCLFRETARERGLGFALFLLPVVFPGYMQLEYQETQVEMEGKILSVLYQFLKGIARIRIAGMENRALFK